MQKTYAIVASLVTLISLITISCNHPENEGENLAKIHCASCHQFPDPSLLDKKTWTENVLPQMAELMNVDIYYNPYSTSGPDGDINVKRVRPDNLFPNEKFQKIYQYYLSAAPAKAIERKDNLAAIVTGLKNVKPHFIANKFSNALTTFVQIDTADRKIFFADANAGKLFSLNQQFDIIDSVNAGKGTVAMLNTNNGMQVLSMGILSPSDSKLGKLSLINKNKNNSTLLDSLQRPVFVSYADLDNDKKEDIVVNEFGFRQGSLNWYKNMGNGKYEKHLLRALPGAIRTEIFDFNKDGRPDIIALMAQGDEGVFIYYNEGNGKFREERVASFPPCMAPAIFSCSIITRMALWIFLQQTETMQTIPFH